MEGQKVKVISWRGGCVLLLALAFPLFASSCASSGGKGSGGPKAVMDLALDSAGGRMFYKGSAAIPRSFKSSTAFDMEIQLTEWGNPPANAASARAAKIFGKEYGKSGRYQPLGNGEGEIQLARGRLQLRGVILDNGQELDGDWFIDGEHGGGFRIARKGYLFP